MKRTSFVLIALSVAALFASHGSASTFARPTVVVEPPAPAARFPGDRPSYARRDFGGVQRIVKFASQIQHVVLIYMENRTPDDLFSGYYSAPFPGGGTYGSALDLRDPNATPTLAPNPPEAYYDPDHSHRHGFVPEAAGNYKVVLGCRNQQCPPNASALAYVPAPEPSPYLAMISNFAYADHVLQANAGPSYVAHQYSIAGQSGGIGDNAPPPFRYAPNAQSENPSKVAGGEGELTGNCFSGTTYTEPTLDMLDPYPGSDGNPHPPCAEYHTILDEIVGALGEPRVADWQFIASAENSIWAAPMAIDHLYANYVKDPTKEAEPFAVDPDAIKFVNNLSATNPSRPFAALTYITPCGLESDHPILKGKNDGPAWLTYVVNAIGESKYWPNTTIIVTWDDWGGFYDHYRPPGSWPYHPNPNPYGNAEDTNEWGFRVPLIVISPYVVHRGYVSTKLRSQSAILNYVEHTFNLPSLGADDMTNGTDDLGDLFDLKRKPAAYVPVTGGSVFNPKSFTCSVI